MFDYEAGIRAWRDDLARAGLEPAVVQELEEHLREDVARQVEAGGNAAQAFQAARQRIGAPADLNREFALLEPRGILGTLRRHGWKLALCGAIGLTAALLLPLVQPVSFQSEAKLLLRFAVTEVHPTTPGGMSVIPLTAVSKHTAFIDEQLQILSGSLLAQRVAASLGAQQLLAGAGGGDDLAQAASLIQGGLTVRTMKNSSVINLTFRHPDSTLLQGVLREVIRQYLQLQAANRTGEHGDPTPITRVSNVSTVQSPSPPYVNSAPLLRIQGTVIAAGLLVGLFWLLLARFAPAGPKLAR